MRDPFAALVLELRRALFRLRQAERWRELQQLRRSTDPDGYSLAAFDRLRCIFVHVPKCAGVAISSALFGSLAGGHRNIRTYQLVFSRREFGSYFKFAFVRNPWDRLASAYSFLRRGGFSPADRAWARANLDRYPDFRSFVRGWVREENVGRWNHFLPQTHFLCIGDVLALDFIGYYENLAEDYELVRARLGVGGPLVERNAPGGRRPPGQFETLYDEETRRIVADVYRRDVELLGYEFDNGSLAAQLSQRGIPEAGTGDRTGGSA